MVAAGEKNTWAVCLVKWVIRHREQWERENAPSHLVEEATALIEVIEKQLDQERVPRLAPDFLKSLQITCDRDSGDGVCG